ncbi:hypothetical protein Droror1_Dr00017894 [Drosera rotundifolia]
MGTTAEPRGEGGGTRSMTEEEEEEEEEEGEGEGLRGLHRKETDVRIRMRTDLDRSDHCYPTTVTGSNLIRYFRGGERLSTEVREFAERGGERLSTERESEREAERGRSMRRGNRGRLGCSLFRYSAGEDIHGL